MVRGAKLWSDVEKSCQRMPTLEVRQYSLSILSLSGAVDSLDLDIRITHRRYLIILHMLGLYCVLKHCMRLAMSAKSGETTMVTVSISICDQYQDMDVLPRSTTAGN